MDKLIDMPCYALVTTGRTGADFLQSLFDSHPDVLTFNGVLFYHSFWKDSTCVRAGQFELGDLVDEFIGRHIEKFKSRYDVKEGKDSLGEDGKQSIDIDTDKFKLCVVGLLGERKVTSKNFMLAVYASYAISLGQDIGKKKILFHHAHHLVELDGFLKDFPDSKIICMTRDPRANFVSGIENWRRYDPSTDNGSHLYFYIKRILADAASLNKYPNPHVSLRIEDLGDEGVLHKLAEWLNISYDPCMTKSTWAGLRWRGDRLTSKKIEESGFSKAVLNNNWQKRLSAKDKYVLNYIMYYRLVHYGYDSKGISIIDTILVPLLIMLPLGYEMRFFSLSYIKSLIIRKDYSLFVKNLIYYLRRILLFFTYYLKTLLARKFNEPFLSLSKNTDAL